MFWILLCLIIPLLFIYNYALRAIQGLPPGPFCLPLLGSLPFLIISKFFRKTGVQEEFCLKAKEFGPITSTYWGNCLLITLNSYDVIKEACIDNGQIFSGRPQTPFHQLNREGGGIVFSEGSLWKEHRRFGLKVLRDFGLGKNLMQQKILEEGEELIKRIGEYSDQPVRSHDFLYKAVSNIISQMVFGERLGYDNPEFDTLLENVIGLTQKGTLATFFPLFWSSLAKPSIINYLPATKMFYNDEKEVEKFCHRKILSIEKDYNFENEPNSFVEAYLKEKQALESHQDGIDSKTKQEHTFTIKQLAVTCMDLFVAGTDTTTNSLAWCLLYLSKHSELQEELYKSIVDSWGERGYIDYSKRNELPKVLAFLDEVQRKSTLVCRSVERRVEIDTTLRGYKIPSSAIIYSSLAAVHHDPVLWDRPEIFSLDRFLNKDGTYKSSPYLNPFGIGKRSCLGESLARMELFIFLVLLIKNFKISIDKTTRDQLDEVFRGTEGLIHAPNPHFIIFTKRS